MKEQMTTHEEELVRLRRIEGQVRGIQKMITEKREVLYRYLDPNLVSRRSYHECRREYPAEAPERLCSRIVHQGE